MAEHVDELIDDEDFVADELEVPDELDEVLVDEVDLDVDTDADEEEDLDVVVEPLVAKAVGVAKADAEEDDDDEPDPDDVEADLDAILKDRIAAPDDEEDEEEEDAGVPEPEGAEGGGRIQPKRPGEFVCQSCFLVKHPSQMADEEHQLCLDCV